ncbi:hypothetical protein [Sphingomonas aerophila]|uniref:Uncharacterized protein n=1 Tax=Sphingomonas aerophila TaxID=1344948 RepID=A0A7W9BFG8_9SPHN|nr:hypothetical protein [Sphingomonas aerophila]MBB5716259.1 hypothetical protein [Sphingomonas aerophila]
MQWFERFATEGLLLPALEVAFGSLVVLRASSTRQLTKDQLDEAPAWIRWLAQLNSERLHRRCGWVMIVSALLIAIMRISAQ